MSKSEFPLYAYPDGYALFSGERSLVVRVRRHRASVLYPLHLVTEGFFGNDFQSSTPKSSRYQSRASRSLQPEYGSQVVSPRFHCTKNNTLFFSHQWATMSSTNHSSSSVLPKS